MCCASKYKHILTKPDFTYNYLLSILLKKLSQWNKQVTSNKSKFPFLPIHKTSGGKGISGSFA